MAIQNSALFFETDVTLFQLAELNMAKLCHPAATVRWHFSQHVSFTCRVEKLRLTTKLQCLQMQLRVAKHYDFRVPQCRIIHTSHNHAHCNIVLAGKFQGVLRKDCTDEEYNM